MAPNGNACGRLFEWIQFGALHPHLWPAARGSIYSAAANNRNDLSEILRSLSDCPPGWMDTSYPWSWSFNGAGQLKGGMEGDEVA